MGPARNILPRRPVEKAEVERPATKRSQSYTIRRPQALGEIIIQEHETEEGTKAIPDIVPGKQRAGLNSVTKVKNCSDLSALIAKGIPR